MKFRPPRFSVRTLDIFVTLFCAYFEVWEMTRINTVTRTGRIVTGVNPTSIALVKVPMPFLVVQGEFEHQHEHVDGGKIVMHYKKKRSFYLWLIGPMFRLPVESEWK